MNRIARRFLPALALLAVLAGVLVRAAMPEGDAVTLRALDVGQGDAILIQDGSNQLLIDGGPDNAVLAGLGDAMPLFDRTIEEMVLTHPHMDHYAGLIPVLARYHVKKIMLGRADGDKGEYQSFLAAVAWSGAEVTQVGAGDAFDLSPRVHLAVLYPPPAGSADRAHVLTAADKNASSVVMRMDTGGHSALLTGDATAEVEAWLLAHGADVHADILKVAHHGSRYSSTLAFLQAVHAEYALISVGAKNDYHHPAWSTIQRLNALGARVYRTDQDGTVTARFTAAGVEVRASKGRP
ncbi:MAG: hypothetical protein RLZZ324_188 [Candidatus Parcubacteria bacterium]|jgi:competence protein ComEC